MLKHTHTQTHTHRHTHTDTDTQTHRQTDTHTHAHIFIDRLTDTHTCGVPLHSSPVFNIPRHFCRFWRAEGTPRVDSKAPSESRGYITHEEHCVLRAESGTLNRFRSAGLFVGPGV